jgi:hypothetical protein
MFATVLRLFYSEVTEDVLVGFDSKPAPFPEKGCGTRLWRKK